MQAIDAYMRGHDNNFKLMRLLAALFIAFYHCYFMVLGPTMSDQTYPLLYQASQTVLNFFFIISGFLIAQSFQKRRDLISYIWARALRLLPGVIVLSLLLAFVVGPLVSEVSLRAYFSDLQTYAYVLLTTALDPDATLPGVFASNPLPHEIDQALWTLRYEVLCYVALAFLGLCGGLASNRVFFSLMGLFLGLYLVVTYATSLRDIAPFNHLMHFGFSFALGTIFFVYRAFIPLSLPLAVSLAGLGIAAHWFFGPSAEPLFLIATAYVVFWLGYVPGGKIRAFNKHGDYSYGVYIYHFPTEQVLVHLIGGFSVLGLYLTALPLVFALAYVSWWFVEQPALAQSEAITLKFKQLFLRATD